MTRKTIHLIFLAIAATVGLLFWQSCRINNWTIRNAEVANGPVGCFGDSLVSGVGAETPEAAYPARLQQTIGKHIEVVGTPGHTSADGLVWLRDNPVAFTGKGVIIVTLGGNDLIQRRPWADTERDLRAIFTELQQRGALVVYTGISLPIFGDQTAEQRALCRECGVFFIPNLLSGVFINGTLKADKVHPNGAGYAVVANHVAQSLKKLPRFNR